MAGCHHVQRPLSARRMTPAQLNTSANAYMKLLLDKHPFVAPSGTQTELNCGSAVRVLTSDNGKLYADFLVRVTSDNSPLYTPEARLFFAEMAVDAFLNHDFQFSSSFYGMYKLITAVLNKPGGIRALFADPTFFLMDLQRTLFDERNLLAAMQGNPIITCDCLNVEDPYHKDFGKVIPSNLLFDVDLMERPRGYKVDCSYCQKRPDLVNDGVDFKKCARCHRVRYCSVECQKLAWPSHKSLCGIKSADWWGRTPRMSKQERIDLGLV